MPALNVCLTFDAEFPDQPHNIDACEGVPTILHNLKKADVLATFFIQGKWARAYPRLAADIAGGGHQIGVHSNAHTAAGMMIREAFAQDTEVAIKRVFEATQCDPLPWYRYPYGVADHEPVLQQMGLRQVGWNVDSEDYNPKLASGDQVAINVLGAIEEMVQYAPLEELPGQDVRVVDVSAIVLHHTWPVGTTRSLRLEIDKLKDMGAEFGVLG